jgi:hypothetical protein
MKHSLAGVLGVVKHQKGSHKHKRIEYEIKKRIISIN